MLNSVTSGNDPSSDVQLLDGPNEAVGRVQVRRNNVWGAICDDSWGKEDAMVICRMLCYKSVLCQCDVMSTQFAL